MDAFHVAAQQQSSLQGAYVTILACGPDSAEASAELLAASVLGSGRAGAAIEIYSLPDLKRTQVLSDPHCGSPAADFAFFRRSPSCLVSCGEDGTVQLWDLRAGDAPQRKFRPACYGDGALPASVAVSGDDRRCAYSCGSRVHLLDLGEGEELFAHEDAHSQPVTSVRFRPAPSRSDELLTAGDDGLICALDVERCISGGTAIEDDAGLRLVLNGGESVQRLGFLGEDASVAYTVSTTDVVQLWSLHEGRPGSCGRFEDLRAHEQLRQGDTDGYVLGALYDAESGRAHVLAGAIDGSMLLFHLNLEAATVSAVMPAGDANARGHRRAPRCMVPLIGGGLGGSQGGFVTGGEDGRICVWRPGAPEGAPSAPGGGGGAKRSRQQWWQHRKERKRDHQPAAP